MKTAPDSLRSWLREQVHQVLGHKMKPPPFIVWCDPERVWKDLLLAAAEGKAFELWAEETHELILRERFCVTPRSPRVVWIPVAREELGYFRVFELQAADVKEWTLPQALTEYGVQLPHDQMSELKPLLASHAKEWIDRPKSAWSELTVGMAKGTLVDDDRVLEVLATPGLSFEKLVADDRFDVFVRRAVDDFGLPAPTSDDAEGWRRQAVATILCTDAAEMVPDTPPSEQQRIIPQGVRRDNALKLRDRWLKRIDLVDFFELLADQADGSTTLQYWARNLGELPPPLVSPVAENALFQVELQRLSSVDRFDELAAYLDGRISAYQAHAKAFWGAQAKARVRWSYLVDLAAIASLLQQQEGVEQAWKAPKDAIDWFTRSGWQVDQAGERLFIEDANLPKGLGGTIGVRVKLRKAYLRHLDRVNAVFSELLSHTDLDEMSLPFAGEAIDEVIGKASAKQPVAVMVLDACRYDLGCRLAGMLNQGEPVQRARVSAARAPLPSITPLGMALCLPGSHNELKVRLGAEGGSWQITAEGFDGDLANAEHRRNWLKRTFRLKDEALLRIADVLSAGDDGVTVKKLGRIVFVFGDEFDSEGHEGRLQLTGTEDHLERYARAIRQLRSGGYSTVAMATDHGFFHWDPADDEKDFPKPDGDVRWSSRRAIVGRDLKAGNALKFPVTGSTNLECCVPRGVATFRTYGGLGFFHGGATLQELITPVLMATWPKKAKKIGVVLKPVSHITSVSQRIEVASSIQKDLLGGVDENLLGRHVVVKVSDPKTGKVVFKSKATASIEPGGETQALELVKLEGAEGSVGATLWLQVVDADDEEILDRRDVTLGVDLDEWF